MEGYSGEPGSPVSPRKFDLVTWAPPRCSICKSLKASLVPARDSVRASSYTPLSEFRKSRDAGCVGCGIILDVIDAFAPGWAQMHKAQGAILLQDSFSPGSLSVRLQPATDLRDKEVDIFQDEEVYGTDMLREPFASRPEIVRDTRSDAAFARIASWIEGCFGHYYCEVAADVKFMPHRVVDVGLTQQEAGSQGDHVRLLDVEFDEVLRTPAPYAALSYCWGDGDNYKTEQANRRERRNGILLERLPKTVQDAVFVCRGLKIPYLWVDALCIVQDDKDDWRHQSAQMHHIYANSFLTIAAHEAASCNDGFLGVQNLGNSIFQESFTAKVELGAAIANAADSGPTTSGGYVRLQLRKHSPWAGIPRGPSPLMRRGWTLQETLLPRRILHYTGDELAWECTASYFCECGHITDDAQDNDEIPAVRTKTMLGSLVRPMLRGDGMVSSKGMWMRLVEEYTKRKLKEPSDKLIAMSGLAQMIGPRTARPGSPDADDDEPSDSSSFYLAGIFRRCLPCQLLWDTRSGDHQPSPPPAPTWSWASIGGQVWYPRELYHYEDEQESHVTICHAETYCVPVAEGDQTGAVTSGTLSIEGLVVPVRLANVARPGVRGQDSLVRGPNGCLRKVSRDVWRPVEVEEGDVGYRCWTDPHHHRCHECDRPLTDEAKNRYWCLKVATYGRGNSDAATFFLLFEQLETVEGGAWERVGIGLLSNNEDGGDGRLGLFEGAERRKIRII